RLRPVPEAFDLPQGCCVVGGGANRLDVHDLFLNDGGIDLVVLGVPADEADVDGKELVLHGDDDPVPVAFDIEHDAVAREKASRWKCGLDVVRPAPTCSLKLGEPGEKRLACVGVRVRECPDRRAVEDAHILNLSMFPKREHPWTL